MNKINKIILFIPLIVPVAWADEWDYSISNTEIIHPDTREYYNPYPEEIDTRWRDSGIFDDNQQLFEFDPLNVEIRKNYYVD